MAQELKDAASLRSQLKALIDATPPSAPLTSHAAAAMLRAQGLAHATDDKVAVALSDMWRRTPRQVSRVPHTDPIYHNIKYAYHQGVFDKPAVKEPKVAVKVKPTLVPSPTLDGKPLIHVQADKITIDHPRCKVVVDLTGLEGA